MDLTGEFHIPASQQHVWEALNEPDVLQQCIPGCESLEKISDTKLDAKIQVKIGPVNVKFDTHIQLSNLNPPESYTIMGEGKGGAAGFAKGGADVILEQNQDQTVLRYTAKVQLGGKLAQLGSRLVQGAAKKMADDFFRNFVKQLGVEVTEERQAEDQVPDFFKTETTGRSKLPVSPWVIIGMIVIIVAYIWWFMMGYGTVER